MFLWPLLCSPFTGTKETPCVHRPRLVSCSSSHQEGQVSAQGLGFCWEVQASRLYQSESTPCCHLSPLFLLPICEIASTVKPSYSAYFRLPSSCHFRGAYMLAFKHPPSVREFIVWAEVPLFMILFVLVFNGVLSGVLPVALLAEYMSRSRIPSKVMSP